MKFGVVVFPGSNCDLDAYHLVKDVLGEPVDYIWHQEENVSGFDCLILPGGFSYGDYLRCGAIARFSPVMKSVVAFARSGGLVIGICNGFQVLQEAGLLPGALYRNLSLQFRCYFTYLKVENRQTPFTSGLEVGRLLKIPIAHGEGNYYADADTLRRMEANGQIVFRYATADGEVTDTANPNGSLTNIAGVCNEMKNVLGMMPHPERAGEAALGSQDGRLIFESILKNWEGAR
ncbi:MAG: phosphoribosylformylglycinamidine synthase subunit PurQ [Dethiobacter sp.]|nr:phosphoribosylformylglycinamidine synthase subunit PurQ [Dethiobacter sp.]MBS3900297.1 phosphoribosylformylglycinamidine synthase subunit PurQ [Dethiobacter sp.]MBS3982684.1 phosphoribosylformylglycinamidine synthase subunit PurQ [Dethiobacter sp.]MCL4462898.1 phosphoribosylformylglycinamidine synthase subunit PurQ [Bacillota bacterium]MCL5993411.1 phosphoribosylformylglycinamidine synthase subunit PurQ [Bacillota bacterium]